MTPTSDKTSGIRKVGTFLVRGYQVCISPLFPPCCRFTPTCSTYALESVRRFGLIKGVYLTVTRLMRCHPFCKFGEDPVPEQFTWTPWRAMSHEPLEELVSWDR